MRYLRMFKALSAGLLSMMPIAVCAQATERDSRKVVVTAPREALPTKRVHYGDLNLQAAAGQDALNSRVKGVAQSLCGASVSTVLLYQIMWQRDCMRSAIDSAQPQVAAAIQRAKLPGDNGIVAASLVVTGIR